MNDVTGLMTEWLLRCAGAQLIDTKCASLQLLHKDNFPEHALSAEDF